MPLPFPCGSLLCLAGRSGWTAVLCSRAEKVAAGALLGPGLGEAVRLCRQRSAPCGPLTGRLLPGGCSVLSDAFSASVGMIVCSFSFTLGDISC